MKEAVRDTPTADNKAELLRLSRLSHDEQREEVAKGGPPSPAEQVVAKVESMRRHAKSLFSAAEDLDVFRRQHGIGSLASPAILTMRSMLVAAKGSIEMTLEWMEGDANA